MTQHAPIILDVAGLTLTKIDTARLENPLTGGVILFGRNWQDRSQLTQLCAQKIFIRRADGVERPEGAKPSSDVGLPAELVAQELPRVGYAAAVDQAVRELHSGLTRKPFVPVGVERDELRHAEPGHVAPRTGPGVAVGNLVDAAAQPVLAGPVVIVAGVGPVADEDTAVRTVADCKYLKPSFFGPIGLIRKFHPAAINVQ